jgi:hypothetical protein
MKSSSEKRDLEKLSMTVTHRGVRKAMIHPTLL